MMFSEICRLSFLIVSDNFQITKLKIESNPFAKGFRDSSSQDSDEPFPTPFGAMSCGLPGGMPGLDPFAQMRPDNNNLVEAAEKARLMMMYRTAGSFLPPPRPPSLALPPSLPPDLLARYSAVQATLGLYNPSFLAAALRTSSAPPPALLPATSQPPPALVAKAGGDGKPPRFSPYVVPASTASRNAESPSHFSTASDGEARSPSPRSSPPPPPALGKPFPLYR